MDFQITQRLSFIIYDRVIKNGIITRIREIGKKLRSAPEEGFKTILRLKIFWQNYNLIWPKPNFRLFFP